MLTPDKAIEILALDLTYTYPARYNDLQDAVNLGREALIKLQDIRTRFPTLMPDPLPGEDPIFDNTRSLHTIKKVLESPRGSESGQ
jgi:hypothetical protein